MTEVQLSFASPPIVEVVAGVAFEGLGPDHAPLLNAFWAEKLRHQYPRLEQQVPYFPPVERFEQGTAGVKSLQLGVGMPPIRLWALTADGQELLQLQPGWFACNWRRVQPHQDYDRWPARREAFSHSFQDLVHFLVGEGVGEPKLTQCEVTYINHIGAGDVWQRHGDFQRVFALSFSRDIGLPLEEMTAQATFVLRRDEEPFGRLHVKVFPAVDREGTAPLYVLELTARGRPDGDGLTGALGFLDKGHMAINQLFAALTTPEVQEAWGRER
jgi:uncharacterized protein (TIGR04255 family)